MGLLLIVVVMTAAGQEGKRIFRDRQIRRNMLRAAEWQLQNPKHNLFDWTNGAFYAGVFAAWESTGSPGLMKAMEEMGRANAWKPGPRLHHADDHVIAQTYVDLYRVVKDPAMIAPFRQTLERFRKTPFPAKGIERITWWWCDALFMGPPAFVKLGITLGDTSLLGLSDRLFRETYDLLYDKEEHLYARDLNYKWGEPGINPLTEANGRKIFWSRGNGWVLAGLARILKELPSDYPLRPFYEEHFREMAVKIATLQCADGLWRASLLDPEAYPGGEASGSGFYCYALAWGVNNGLLDREVFLPVVRRAWTGLHSLLQPDGRVGWVQPIGADPRKNFSAESWEVYGTGAYLLAGSEVIKLF